MRCCMLLHQLFLAKKEKKSFLSLEISKWYVIKGVRSVLTYPGVRTLPTSVPELGSGFEHVVCVPQTEQTPHGGECGSVRRMDALMTSFPFFPFLLLCISQLK